MGFENGVWKCDCDPPRPAVKRQTRTSKNGNKGRWFYGCSRDMKDTTKCRFFIWQDEALQQETAALQDIRNNPNPNVSTPIKREQDLPLPYVVEAGPSDPNRKRKHAVNQILADDFDGDVDEDELNDLMTEIETPSKAAKTTHFATPTTVRRKLPWQMGQPDEIIANGLPTPQTNRRTSNNIFGSEYPAPGGSFFIPSKHNEDDHRQTATPSSSFETPTRSRIQNVGGEDLAHDVLSLLQDANIVLPDNSERELKQLLAKQARRAEGFKRGCDLAQQTVKARDAKANELNLRIHTLELELAAEKQRVENLEWEAQDVEIP